MKISVVIPALNEASGIESVVEHTRALQPHEVIVVDGQSTDDTADRARAADLVLTSPPGRADQQNLGAANASGDVLLFLHADSRLSADSLEQIEASLTDQAVVGGCLVQRIDAPGVLYRIVERGNTVRVRLLKWAYGDQGIFVRRDVFDELGGFPRVALMEDLMFMKRLKKRGRIAVAQSTIHTSARRWQSRGVLRQTARNWMFIMLAHCGVSLERLANWYPHVRAESERDDVAAD